MGVSQTGKVQVTMGNTDARRPPADPGSCDAHNYRRHSTVQQAYVTGPLSPFLRWQALCSFALVRCSQVATIVKHRLLRASKAPCGRWHIHYCSLQALAETSAL